MLATLHCLEPFCAAISGPAINTCITVFVSNNQPRKHCESLPATLVLCIASVASTPTRNLGTLLLSPESLSSPITQSCLSACLSAPVSFTWSEQVLPYPAQPYSFTPCPGGRLSRVPRRCSRQCLAVAFNSRDSGSSCTNLQGIYPSLARRGDRTFSVTCSTLAGRVGRVGRARRRTRFRPGPRV